MSPTCNLFIRHFLQNEFSLLYITINQDSIQYHSTKLNVKWVEAVHYNTSGVQILNNCKKELHDICIWDYDIIPGGSLY